MDEMTREVTESLRKVCKETLSNYVEELEQKTKDRRRGAEIRGQKRRRKRNVNDRRREVEIRGQKKK